MALTPAALLLAQNIQLQEQIRELRQQSRHASPVAMAENKAARPVTAVVSPPPVATPPQHTQAKAMEQAREQAVLELTRISLNLPDLTETQKAQIQAVFERRNAGKLTAKMAAFDSGAVRRYALNPDHLSDEDRALLHAMEPRKIPPSEDEQLRLVLSPGQFAEYIRTEEAKRVSNAEAAAADVLKAIGRSIDLQPAQKDRIFQTLARLELDGPAMNDDQRAAPFGEREATEDARDQIVLAELTPGQAEVYSKFRAERKAGFMEFLKSFGPREGAQ